MTIEDFLSLESPEKYDFSNDSACVEYQLIRSPIEKYIVYKAYAEREDRWKSKDKRNYPNGIVYPEGKEYSDWIRQRYWGFKDPDSNSPLLQRIYRKLWSEDLLRGTQKGKHVCADTLNSAQTTVNATIKSLNMDDCFRCRGEISVKYAISLYATYRDVFTCRLASVFGLNDFLSLYHTLGNFMPVPMCFNTARTQKTCDYWDLTLLGIYHWFKEDKSTSDTGIDEVVGTAKYYPKQRDNIESCKKWIGQTYGSGLEGWRNFVEKNYLQDFVNFCPINGYTAPKELWRGHFGGALCPKGEDEFKQFYVNASSWILARGNRMVIALKEKARLRDN